MQHSINPSENFFSNLENRDVILLIASYLSFEDIVKLTRVNKLLNQVIKNATVPFYLLQDKKRMPLTYNEALTHSKQILNLMRVMRKLTRSSSIYAGLESYFLSFSLEIDKYPHYFMLAFLLENSIITAAIFSAQRVNIDHYFRQAIIQSFVSTILIFIYVFYMRIPLNISKIIQLLDAVSTIAILSALYSGPAVMLTTYLELNKLLALAIQSIPTVVMVFILTIHSQSNFHNFKAIIENHIKDTLYGLSCSMMCALTFSVFNTIFGGINDVLLDYAKPCDPIPPNMGELIVQNIIIAPFNGMIAGAYTGVAVATTMGSSYRATHYFGQHLFKYRKKQKQEQIKYLENEYEKVRLVSFT